MGIRIHEASKKFNVSNKQLADVLTSLGYTGKTIAVAGLADEWVAKLEKHFSAKSAPVEPKKENKPVQVQQPQKPVVKPVQQQNQNQGNKPVQNQQNNQNRQQNNQGRPYNQQNQQNQQNNQNRNQNQQNNQNQNRPNNNNNGYQKQGQQNQGQKPQGFKSNNQPQPYFGESDRESGRKNFENKQNNRDKDRRDRDYDDYEQSERNDRNDRQNDRMNDRRIDKKRLGPKIHIEDDDDEIEVNKQITIIKTASPKKDNQLSNKKKHDKNKNKRAHFSKKVQAEMREQERQTEAMLDRNKNQQVNDEDDSMPKLMVPRDVTVSQLAKYLEIDAIAIIKKLFELGVVASLNQRLEEDHIQLIGAEYGKEIVFSETVFEIEDTKDDPKDLRVRPPVVTVMGHVDHGKTSLIDYIRHAHVAAKEAGGITQHIGAYQVKIPNGTITFIDTPGHEAFTAMRARGAQATDIAVLVVAADDGIMPQTVEAINHAQAAGVPMVFAITKIDKPNADVEKIKAELANMNILVEDWGGKYQCQEIDAKHGVNVNELLEKVLLEAEMLNLRANPNRRGIGAVIESSLDKGRGYIAKVLVQTGTLSIGDPILAGSCYGKVKAMFNERNQPVKSAGPATPVLLLGLNGAPQAGDSFKVCESEQDARNVATKRARLAREMGLRTQKHITLDEIGRRIAIGDFKELNIIVKGDVDGSVEALSGELLKLSTEQVQVNVIHKSVGAVTETDVMLAMASNALIAAFQVRPTAGARKAAEAEQIDIRTYSIIYQAINEIKDAIAGMHSPEIREKVVANIEVREVFHISKVGNVAGCMVLDGKLQRATKIRLIRDGIVIYTGKLGSLRRFKDDVKEVVSGQDCGLNIDGCNDIKVGDIIEGYEEYEIAYNANNTK
mgnify:CR=1 FL=1